MESNTSKTSKRAYVHGYTTREAQRLNDQARTLEELLHDDTRYTAGSLVLEAGCGIGAQTVALAKNSPRARFVSIDVSPVSLTRAEEAVRARKLSNVSFLQADLFSLPFPDAHFDHLFVCFVLEHLQDPVAALKALRAKLKPGGSITVIEGDHGSCFFHPETREGRTVWEALIKVQATLGGDSNIGRRLFPLLEGAGFREIGVSPRVIYADHSKPRLVDGFVKKTIIPMVQGVRRQALAAGLADAALWRKGIRDLYATAARRGTFYYTFFKGVAVK